MAGSVSCPGAVGTQVIVCVRVPVMYLPSVLSLNCGCDAYIFTPDDAAKGMLGNAVADKPSAATTMVRLMASPTRATFAPTFAFAALLPAS